MKKLVFSTLYVIRLSVENLFGLVKSTLDLATAVKADLGDLANAALTQLTADYKKYQQVVKKQRKSKLTEQLLVAEKDRNDRFAEIKRTVTLHLKGRDAQKKAAAKTLNFFFTPYWDVAIKPLNTETGLLSEMFGKYNADTNVQDAALNNGINILLTELETANSDYDVLYKKRLAEGADQPDESASEQKREVCNSYTQFCNIIEQEVNFTPKESVLTLFKNMDELRKTYHAMIPNVKDKVVEEPTKTGE